MASPTAELNILVKATDKASGKLKGIGQMGSQMGKLVKAGALVGGAAVLALGVAAFKVGADFQDAYATIRAGTGATGEALAGLKDDFKATLSQVPQDMEEVATATADLNTRLGLTGEPLQAMSKQFLDLARITGEEVGPAIAAGTRVFGDWSIATGDQEGALDHLFKVSQATGIGVTELSDKVVQFGAPLRQMGFNFEDATALMGKWEKEGVNSEAILGALKIGVANFAKEGVDASTGLQNFISDIQELGPGAEATSLAIEKFGSRAGPDMVAAVLEGRFALDDLKAAVAASGETIEGAGEDALTLRDKFGILKNKVIVALEPAIMKFMDALEKVGEWLGDKVPKAVDKLKQKWAEHQGKIDAAKAAFVKLGEIIKNDVYPVVKKIYDFLNNNREILAAVAIAIAVVLVPAFIAWAVSAGAAAVATLLAMAPIILIIAVIALLVLGIIKLVEHWDEVVTFIKGAWKEATDFAVEKAIWLKDQIVEKFQLVKDKAVDILKKLKDLLIENWYIIFGLPVYLAIKFRGKILDIITKVKDGIVGGITAIPGKLTALGGAFLNAAKWLGSMILSGLLEGLKATGGFIADLATNVTNAIIKVLNFGIQGINNLIPDSLDFKYKGVGLSIDIPDNPIPPIPTLARGGQVLRTGLAVVHEGEQFSGVPGARGFGGVSVTVNVQGGFFGGPVDAGRLGRIISRQVQQELARQ